MTMNIFCHTEVNNFRVFFFFLSVSINSAKSHFVQIFVFVPCSPTYALDGTGKYVNSQIICTGTVFFFLQILRISVGEGMFCFCQKSTGKWRTGTGTGTL